MPIDTLKLGTCEDVFGSLINIESGSSANVKALSFVDVLYQGSPLTELFRANYHENAKEKE